MSADQNQHSDPFDAGGQVTHQHSDQQNSLLSNLGATWTTHDPHPRLPAPCSRCGGLLALHYLYKGEPFLTCAACYAREVRPESA